ncbi:MAG TPA: ATP-dependent Clp protease adapter ClpS [Spirochaetota bacterium]|nr:ATP-dependent Clp protease adapter ClpS [Spirochaetota bacterium]HOT20844.1 ATP-dependent Clp protease adapter ClpS [Spirochaetota bacterium]HPD05691.1 ATP-dependent Clp protease adapter ClpS [Spirochaetota bacterium]HQG41488.1 ATP-dependent Clp protease adapter ClpS [Spirochaetota bacterium]HQK06248.1 ATP-dependent Clp protease adapter ClpS [Spirochaetota bacterium]
MAHRYEYDGNLQIKEDVQVKKPRMYKVILHNDHYTTMDFVVEVLVTIFHKNNMEATELMLQVHRNGFGICGVYTYDIAQTKAGQVHTLARQREFPLKCTVEEA